VEEAKDSKGHWRKHEMRVTRPGRGWWGVGPSIGGAVRH